MTRHSRLRDSITGGNFYLSPTLRDASELRQVEDRTFVHRLLSQYGNVPLAVIDQRWAEAAERRLYPAASSATRHRQFWTPLISILHGAAKGIDYKPVNLKRPSGTTVKPARWLRPDEAQRLIDNSAPHLALLLQFMLCTGATPQEAFALNWKALSAETGEVSLPSPDGNLTVSLSKPLLAAFSNRGDRIGSVFRRHDGHEYVAKKNSGGQVKTALRTAAKRAELSDITLSVLEQTWAVWFLAQHGKENLIHAGRWSSERSLRRYLAIPKTEIKALRDTLQSSPLPICEMFRTTKWTDFSEDA